MASSDLQTLSRSRVRPWAPTVLSPGTQVTVDYAGKPYPAVVIGARNGMHLVRYDNYTQKWDEWVDPARIKAVVPGPRVS